jgi:hypothetical protein
VFNLFVDIFAASLYKFKLRFIEEKYTHFIVNI